MKHLLLSFTLLMISIVGVWAQGTNQIDITDLYIENPSFETGDLTGWEINGTISDNGEFVTTEVGAKPANSTYQFDGCEGNYVFNAFHWWATQLSVAQTTASLPSGTYEVTCKAASWSGRKVKLDVSYRGRWNTTTSTSTVTGIGEHQGVLLSSSTFTTNSAILGSNDNPISIKVYADYAWWDGNDTEGSDGFGQCFFKADDFHLYYTVPNNGIANTISTAMTNYAGQFTGTDDPMNASIKSALQTAATQWNNATKKTKLLFETLLEAIHDADESIEIYKEIKELKDYAIGEDATTFAQIQTKYNNGTYVTLQEAIDEYYALAASNLTSDPDTEDFTRLIINPSFEYGTIGWTYTDLIEGMEETGAKNYELSGRDGQYVYNAFHWWASELEVEQTITGLPAGLYDLSAILATWEGRTVILAANDQEVVVNGAGDATGIPTSVPVVVGSDGTLTIKAYSDGTWWEEGHEGEVETFFKADHFQLTRRKESIDLVISAAEWATLILPYNATIPSGVTAYETNGYESDGKTLSMTTASTLVKNTPYIVNGTPGTYHFKEWVDNYYNDSYTVGYLTGCMVQTTIDKTQDGKQNYVLQKQGDHVAFFKVGDATNKTIKAHRAYLSVPQSSEVKLAFYFPDEEGTPTVIDTTAEKNVGIAEVYSLNGQRQQGMQRGINLVRLTNGRVIKINVK